MKLKTIFLIVALPFSLFAQVDTLWTRTFGGAESEGAYSTQTTPDGGFIIAGYTYSFSNGKSDIYMLKTDSEGNEVWSNHFGGANWEYGYSVCTVSDGGYAVAGYTASFGSGGKDMYLVKTDADGIEEWSACYGGEGLEMAMSVCECAGGGFLILGYTESFGSGDDDYYLVKTDENGNEIWTKTYGGTASDMGMSIVETPGGDLMLAGYTGSYGAGNRDMWLVKTNCNGDSLWAHCYGANAYVVGREIIQSSDGGFVLTGSRDYHGSNLMELCFVKTDAEGVMSWILAFGEGQYYEYGSSVCELDDGYLFCGAAKNQPDGTNNVYLVKTDIYGLETWSDQIGGAGSDWGSSVRPAQDGNYIMAGHTNSEGSGAYDVWLVKFRLQESGIKKSGHLLPGKIDSFRPFPNPFNEDASLKFTLNAPAGVELNIYNLKGQKVHTIAEKKYEEGEHNIRFDGEGLTSGIYFAVISVENRKYNFKMALVK